MNEPTVNNQKELKSLWIYLPIKNLKDVRDSFQEFTQHQYKKQNS